MSDKEVKNIDLELKEDTEGKVSAVFSVFNSIDSDGDVVVPGSINSGFKSGDVPMVWAHKWDMPIGKGKITQDEGKATFEGGFFMDTDSGKEAYKIVKNMGDMQQWSFGYKVNDAEVSPYKEGSDEEVDARYLKDLTVFEVSPVLVGANQDTYTMAIKSNEELLKEIVGISDDEKGVMTTESMNQPDPAEEADEEVEEEKGNCNCNCNNDSAGYASVEDAEKRAEELGIEGTHEIEVEGETVIMPGKDSANYLAAISEEQDVDEEMSEKSQTFSEQVKDVLAALDNLIVRANAIAMLRAKDGRKLGVKATEALRAVQEDLNDAWTEVDQFINEVGTEGALELEVEEQQSTEEAEVVEDPTAEAVEVVEPEVITEEEAEVSEEEAEVEPEVDADAPTAVEEDNSESSDDNFDEVWAEGQQLLADTVDIDIEDDEPVV